MKIGVIQASTRTDINQLLFESVKKAAGSHHEVINFGIFPGETVNYSYVEVAVMISLLIETGAIDFVVSGCSSGQGMMMACNSLPGLRCGFVQTPQDAYLFGRINNGNVVSLPLGLNFGWSGELNLQYTLNELFHGEFNIGYPPEAADRKRQEVQLFLELNKLTKKSFLDIIDVLDSRLLSKVLERKNFTDYLFKYGNNQALLTRLHTFKN
ncbi:MAG: RpiB/LacA/LacB family sugar-phosphate isomerase [Streptococcus orisratti]|uniref:RpiB/LacA/LacB family sugar-phosphate isomerase n=1 Tax=Streptococcus orisratti TaxID=114652 RepID=UPI002A91F690|nr:RpiB/LacA/LacB family sugar-phosphate isomerase [Streptococcus orisratti]MDY5635978.1 RpiB/LacA/LacB family sugar-phosphate isomerase [Streptococcus orisratti]